MEFFDLEQGLKNVASAGSVLNCQEMTGIQAGLSLLKSKEKYPQIYFWGKILGQQLDYYIACGLRDTDFEFPSKDFYYASEDFEFKALPRLTEDSADRIIELVSEKERPFTGKPDELLEPPPEGEEPPPEEEGGTQKPPGLTEVDRLAQVVQEIDFDTAVVPKGAHSLNEAHVVVPSNDFRGLGLTEATAISKYAHFRPPTSVACLRALARSDVQFYANFLDTLESDLPKGCWAVRQDPSGALVTLRSLSWPGYVAYHVPLTTKFGGVYFGYGQKNKDLPFLL
mmetsp:Transcript_37215/g.100723  ORF Transcript_37215/g.100723 Transcript_37215/m.100723 type:complete len:283 (-) Transcript_37215:51-899(-)